MVRRGHLNVFTTVKQAFTCTVTLCQRSSKYNLKAIHNNDGHIQFLSWAMPGKWVNNYKTWKPETGHYKCCIIKKAAR
jgi:hypothetical protein